MSHSAVARLIATCALVGAMLTACAPAAPSEPTIPEAKAPTEVAPTPTTQVAAPTAAPAPSPTKIVSKDNAAAAAAASGQPVEVVRADGSTVSLPLADLGKLPLTHITAEGKIEEGPALLAVLEMAGINEFAEVTLRGTGEITLTRDQVTAETILDFTNHGTVKFADPQVNKNTWPKDIRQIEVR